MLYAKCGMQGRPVIGMHYHSNNSTITTELSFSTKVRDFWNLYRKSVCLARRDGSSTRFIEELLSMERKQKALENKSKQFVDLLIQILTTRLSWIFQNNIPYNSRPTLLRRILNFDYKGIQNPLVFQGCSYFLLNHFHSKTRR